MRKFYIFFVVATFAVFSLQALLVNNLYQNYISSESEHIENSARQSIDPDNYLQLFDNKKLTSFLKFAVKFDLNQKNNYIISRNLDTIFSKGDDLQKILRYEQKLDDSQRITLDDYFENNIVINIDSLEILFHKNLNRDYHCIIEIHNSHYIMHNLSNHYNNTKYNFVLEELPIGLRGYQFIRIYANIPISHFIKKYIWILISSMLIILIIIALLLYLIIVIRSKQKQITTRENNIYGIMHNLKSPLSGVAMTLDYAKSKVNNSQVEEIFALNQSKINHMIDGIDSLLTLVGNKNHSVDKGVTREEIDESIKIMVADFRNIYIDKAHFFDFDIQLNDCNRLNINITTLENIIRNLFDNSLKYCDSGVKIEFKIREYSKYVEFQVVDNGWGMDKKHQRKVFKNFYQIPQKSRNSNRGYGIGLSYAYNQIKRHGGKIALKSEINHGTTITFTIPIKNYTNEKYTTY